MSKSLVIVESPAKARTIRKYLGPSYTVKASLGHVKDLPKSKMGVSVDKDFCPEYRIIPGKRKILNELVKSAKSSDNVYLALDPDREGEAIAWHIYEELDAPEEKVHRVLFNEITKKGITEGLHHPHPINLKRFESQQARRILDRLVGYEISPILWKKVRRGLSAGRVQSVALRLVVDREAEIEAFDPKEYWKIAAQLEAGLPPQFMAKYYGKNGKKHEVSEGESAATIKSELEASTFVVDKIDRKERRRTAPPPFITSRLQQEMARRFRFTAKRTMMIAQQLYEGVDVGDDGTVGLITYMRTDSVRLSDDSVTEARAYIEETFGKPFVPSKPNIFKTKKSAQDAHEAIRPTSTQYHPDVVGRYLSRDQKKLYKVVWERFIACQMKPALYDQTVVHIGAGEHALRVSGSVLKFGGWLEAIEGKDAPPANGKNQDDDDAPTELPMMNEGDVLKLVGDGVVTEQKFTQPPPRFTEGTLIRELEERGIGRPSTYATILSTIQDRRYVEKDEGRLKPSELGVIVTERLVLHFPRILDVDFTASMEESLDKVEDGSQDWVRLLADFYVPFQDEVKTALKNMKDVRELTKETDKVCEKCGAKMVEKWGRNGRFLACSAYPECRNTMEVEEKTDVAPLVVDVKCELCGKDMVKKRGRFGDFLACSGYPDCKATRSMPTGIDCPNKDCNGELVERRTKRGRLFYGCSEFNKSGCNFVVWGTPVKEECPECNAKFLVAANRKKGGRNLKCVTEGCTYTKIDGTGA
ncbi:MAG: type I DNA topoisomerase [Deltaproteobacteria bacterium]|nr:type I DNA topoisomerase [Deltaproteobacteria bacterium]MBN2673134.1 type I DNA topoisomerase [Deltaproteobacteria bacterium]